jgi:hypothetical protein
MSTAELKRLIDERTADERRWMAAYLLDGLRSAPETQEGAEALAELSQRRADLQAGRNRVSQAEAEARWAVRDANE